jgi:peroxiredoxin-like protein
MGFEILPHNRCRDPVLQWWSRRLLNIRTPIQNCQRRTQLSYAIDLLQRGVVVGQLVPYVREKDQVAALVFQCGRLRFSMNKFDVPRCVRLVQLVSQQHQHFMLDINRKNLTLCTDSFRNRQTEVAGARSYIGDSHSRLKRKGCKDFVRRKPLQAFRFFQALGFGSRHYAVVQVRITRVCHIERLSAMSLAGKSHRRLSICNTHLALAFLLSEGIMNSEYRFHATAEWTTERRGLVRGDDTPELDFSAPPAFQGIGGIWSPEDLFLGAIVTCFITTFRAIADYSKFHFDGLKVSADGVVEKGEGGFSFTRITVRPVLTIASEADRERGLRLLDKAERACLVSRSIQSTIHLEPVIEVLVTKTSGN